MKKNLLKEQYETIVGIQSEVEGQQNEIKLFFDEETSVESLKKVYLKEFDDELKRLERKKEEKLTEMLNLQAQLHTLETNKKQTNQKVSDMNEYRLND